MASPSLTIFRGFPTTAAYCWSPFATKLEARLRFAGLSYKKDIGAPPKGPRGKIPYLFVEEKNGASETVADSNLISEKLVANGMAEDLNAKLTPAEKAQDMAVRALLEDKVYFYQTYERWEQNYYTLRPVILGSLPYPVQVLVGSLAYRKMSATLYGQGTGRFSPEEISKFKTDVWENVNALLASSRQKKGSDGIFYVLGGNAPTEADTTLFGFIASCLVCDAAPEGRKIIRSLPAVMEYAENIHRQYFPDYKHWE
ncbi:MAG: hypothetical protein Q9216_004704 [Gyalolechia sp. 2 TL-2023]